MKIKALAENKIRVDLTKSDLEGFNITYDELDYSDVKTKRVIWTLLDEAKKTLGQELNISGRLTAEVCEKKNGGCVIFFTLSKEAYAEPPVSLKKEKEALIFKAANENAFIDAAVLLREYSKFPSFNADCFCFHGKYFIAAFFSYEISEKIEALLSEFGDITSKSETEALKLFEYGKRIHSF